MQRQLLGPQGRRGWHRVEHVAADTIGVEVDQLAQLVPQFCEQLRIQVSLEDTVLDVGAIAPQQLEHSGAPLVVNHIVAHNSEHIAPLLE